MNSHRRGAYAWLILALALAVAVEALFWSRGLWAVSWDDSSRTLDAYEWAARGRALIPPWLPGYRVCVGLALRLLPDLFITPRIITFVFGLIAIPACVWIAHELFQSRRTTLITLLLSVFFSQRIALSLSPVSSILFTAPMLVAMAAFARWLRIQDRRALWACAIAAALASTVRYEAWVFDVALLIICVRTFVAEPNKLKVSDLCFLSVLLCTFPAAWMMEMTPAGNPVSFFTSASRQHSTIEMLTKNPLVEFLFTNALTLNLAGAATAFQIARRGNPSQRLFIAAAFLPLLCLSLLLLAINSAQTGPAWRDISVWSMLLIPFTARLLAGEVWTFGPAQRALTFGALVVVLCAFLYDAVRITRDSTWAFPKYDRVAGQYLDTLISSTPEAKVLIESSLFFFVNVEVASQHPDSFVFNSIPEQKSPPLLPVGSSVRTIAQTQRVKFLIFRTPKYKDFLDHSPDVVRLRDFGPWSLYKVAN